jgi:hypothetical protein
MPRTRSRPRPTHAQSLTPVATHCPECSRKFHTDYNNFRTVTTLDGVIRLTLTIRRRPNPDCPRFLRPYRPEAEPHFALPHHEFGLDVPLPRAPTRRRLGRSQRHQPPGPLRRAPRLGQCRPQAAGSAVAPPAPRHLGHRRPPARFRPRGPLALASWCAQVVLKPPSLPARATAARAVRHLAARRQVRRSAAPLPAPPAPRPPRLTNSSLGACNAKTPPSR